MDISKTYGEAADALLAELTLLKDSGVDFVHYPKPAEKPLLSPKEILSTLEAAFKPCKRCGGKNPPETIYATPGEKTRLAVVVESKAPLTSEEDETLRKIIEHEQSLSLTPEEVFVTLAPSECVSVEPGSSKEPSSCTGHIRRTLKGLAPDMIMIMGMPVARAITDESAECSSIKTLSGVPAMPTHSLASIMEDKEAKMALFMDVKAVKSTLSK